MKSFKNLFVLVLFISISLPIYAQDDAKPNVAAVLSKPINNVEHRVNSGEGWDEAKRNQVLVDGSGIKTGFRSFALVKFIDGSLLRVREESIVDIFSTKDGNIQKKDTHIDQGKLSFDVKKEENSHFTFTTPTGVASIKGTAGYIEVIDDEMLVVVEEGIVEVEAKNGEKSKGEVTANNAALVTKLGSVQITPITEQQKKNLKKNKMAKTQKFIIETDEGRFEVEMLVEDRVE